jgi:hypothetical protein
MMCDKNNINEGSEVVPVPKIHAFETSVLEGGEYLRQNSTDLIPGKQPPELNQRWS